MNNVKSGRRSAKNKNQKSKREAYTPKPQRVFGGLICPDEMRVILPYSTRVPQTLSLGVGALYQFRGNSVFDPDLTGTGGVASGHNLWSNFYQKYRVLGSRIRTKTIGTGTTVASTATEVALYPFPDTSVPSVLTPTTFSDARSLKYAKWSLYNSFGNGICTLNHKMGTAKIFGVSEEAVEDDDALYCNTNTNPTQTWTWNLIAEPADVSSSQNIVSIVDIDYDVVYFDRQPTYQS